MLRWLFRGIIWLLVPVIVPVLVSVYYLFYAMLKPVTSPEQNSDVAPHFDHLDLRNAMVLVMTLSVSYDTSASTNGITWLKRSCCTSFQLSWLKKFNGAIDDAISVTWCQWQYVSPGKYLFQIYVSDPRCERPTVADKWKCLWMSQDTCLALGLCIYKHISIVSEVIGINEGKCMPNRNM